MTDMISYSVGSTSINSSATSFTITPPPAYTAGNFFIMGIIGGSETGTAVAANLPSGWTMLSATGAKLAIFSKTATSSEPTSYTITMTAVCTAAAFIAAYPASTITSQVFSNSATGVATFTPSVPSGIGGAQLLVSIAGAVASEPSYNSGYQNVVYPTGFTSEVPVFGPALPSPSPVVYPCAIGLSDVLGSDISGLPTPVLTSPQLCSIYAGFLVLTITGTNASLSVTATADYPSGTPGLALTLKALSGADSLSAITSGGAVTSFYAGGVSQPPQASLTPNGNNSLVYGAVTENFGVTPTAYTPTAATVFSQNVPDNSNNCIYGTLRSTSATTAGTAIILGGSAPDNAYTTAALAEILVEPGHTISEIGTAFATGIIPGDFATTVVAQTAILPVTPANGTLLVAIVSANSHFADGNISVTVTDSAGLIWVPLAQTFYPSYAAVWAAEIGPPPPSVSYGVLMAAWP
jgi:hypothetical protein